MNYSLAEMGRLLWACSEDGTRVSRELRDNASHEHVFVKKRQDKAEIQGLQLPLLHTIICLGEHPYISCEQGGGLRMHSWLIYEYIPYISVLYQDRIRTRWGMVRVYYVTEQRSYRAKFLSSAIFKHDLSAQLV